MGTGRFGLILSYDIIFHWMVSSSDNILPISWNFVEVQEGFALPVGDCTDCRRTGCPPALCRRRCPALHCLSHLISNHSLFIRICEPRVAHCLICDITIMLLSVCNESTFDYTFIVLL